MKSIRFRLFVAALAVMLGTAVAQSQTAHTTTPVAPPAGPHGGMYGPLGMDGHVIQFYAKFLNVTDEQKTQMKAVLQKEKPTLQPLMQQLHQMDQQLKQYEEGTFDEAKVQGLVAQQSQTLVQLKVEQSRIHNELYQLLTSDQQGKLKEFEATREARMQQHMQSAPDASQQ